MTKTPESTSLLLCGSGCDDSSSKSKRDASLLETESRPPAIIRSNDALAAVRRGPHATRRELSWHPSAPVKPAADAHDSPVSHWRRPPAYSLLSACLALCDQHHTYAHTRISITARQTAQTCLPRAASVSSQVSESRPCAAPTALTSLGALACLMRLRVLPAASASTVLAPPHFQL